VREILWLAALVCCVSTPAASAQTLKIAAASDLQAVAPLLASEFQKATGTKVTVTLGSSGNFFTQIQNGAPFDVFLSADVDYPRRLEAAGLAVKGSLCVYAIGRIVLWAPNTSPVDLSRGLTAVADASVRRIAIANPDHAPYGRAAVAALRHEQLYEGVQAKLVRGENISQAAQFVQSGNADLGILALSLALAPALKTTGHHVEIPETFYPRLEQAGIVVAASTEKAAGERFLRFLERPEIVRTMQAYGFVAPPAPPR
jgi:molybdate transport system substrate-binding protein